VEAYVLRQGEIPSVAGGFGFFGRRFPLYQMT
jgi:hypothetical protein